MRPRTRGREASQVCCYSIDIFVIAENAAMTFLSLLAMTRTPVRARGYDSRVTSTPGSYGNRWQMVERSGDWWETV
jgi:hypothetical protein